MPIRVTDMHRGLAIAIDGPAGSGKSTVSRALALATGFDVLDTGAMYRSYAWLVLQQPGVNAADWPQLIAEHEFRTEWSEAGSRAWCDDQEISTEIRSAAVTGLVSEVSAVPAIRELAVKSQRRYVDIALKQGRGVILEGRDIGTVVLPAADCKFFLTADPTRRAERRAGESAADLAATAAAIAERDAADSARPISPLRPADDAILIDSTDLTVGEVVAAMLAAIEAVRP